MRGFGVVRDAQVLAHDGHGHVKAFALRWEVCPAVPVVAAEHDSEFSPRHRVLAGDGFRVEDNAKGAVGILLEGDALREKVAEAGAPEERGVAVVEVYSHDSHIGGKGGVTEGREDEVIRGR